MKSNYQELCQKKVHVEDLFENNQLYATFQRMMKEKDEIVNGLVQKLKASD